MSVLERHIAFRIPRQCPRERKGCSCSRRHRQSSALLTAVRGRAAGPAVDRPGPSVRPAPVVAATAGLVMADQDSSPDPAGRPPRHPRFSLSPAKGFAACWAGAAGGIQVQACVAPTVTAPNAGSVDRSS
jgi:hypothetical protein